LIDRVGSVNDKAKGLIGGEDVLHRALRFLAGLEADKGRLVR